MADPRIVSWSEISTARQCPLKHQLSYVERWSKEPDALSALSKGTAWHLIMEAHYRQLMELQRAGSREPVASRLRMAADRVESLIESDIEPTSPELADLVWWMYNGYVDVYGSDDMWKILAVEHAAQCRLPTITGRASGFVLKMKIDLVVIDLARPRSHNGRPPMVVVDHKSGRELPKDKELDLDDQFGLYTWGMRKLGKPVFGQVHNAARTTRNKGDYPDIVERWHADRAAGLKPGAKPVPQDLDARFLRTPGYRTDAELDVIATEAYMTIKNRYDQQRQVERWGTDAPRSTDPDTCRWKCDYTDPCLAGRKIGPEQMRDYLDARGYRQNFERH